ncbi:MAG TPA: hypothetical protein VMC08_08250 [Bacteroidales bacterium]|nr:hypothetical protein [Bacteroidales bacterium]
MKKLFFFLTICILSVPAISQNASDALRYSRIFYGGSARFQGLAGAMGAVGGDFSVIATNPGGLGIFKSSEISITPNIWIGMSQSDYNGTTANDHKVSFGLGDLGFVFSIPMDKRHRTGGIKYLNFAFGINRQNDFNNRIYIQGQNNTSSMLTDYVNVLNSQPGITPDQINNQYPFDIALAYNANLIFYDTLHNQYMNDAYHGGVMQEKSITTYGSMNEFEFAFGANYNDKLYFGATIGIPYLRYYEHSIYSEAKTDPTIQYFQYLSYEQVLETHGVGVNFKAGLIYRPANWIRIGAAIHTPTFYGMMRDAWSSNMYAEFENNSWNNTQYSPAGNYNYALTTPFRAIGSLAFIIGPYGLISAEYEYDNYNQARFHAQDSFDATNQDIKDSYKSPLNLRFGTEWRIWDFRVRGGFGYYGSPYKNDINDGERLLASGGFGYRGKHFYGDLTYVWTRTTEDYYLYNPELVNPSYNKLYSNSVVMTWGVRF